MSIPVARWARVVAPVVAVAITAVSVGLFLLSKGVSDRQETKLLNDRSSELSLILSLSLADTRSMLLMSGNATLPSGSAEEFKSLTRVSTLGGTTAIVVVRRSADGFKVVAAAGGPAPKVGSSISAKAAAVIGRAPGADGMVSGVVDVGDTKRVIIATAIASDADRVAYLESSLATVDAPADSDSPFHDLNVAAYAGPEAVKDQLFLVSGEIPDPGSPVVEKQFDVGVDTWTLAISARNPLVGSLATAFPWVVLAAGLLTAVFMSLLIETLVRRRIYALRLVEERTGLLQEAQQAAERANNAKSEFLSRMSHELRTPLNAVLGFAQLLELDGITEEQSYNVKQISKGGSHLLDLINEILDISQIESGHLSMSPEPVLVSEVIEEAISLVGPLAGDKAINLISTSNREPDCYVFADRQRLKQILINLLSNGIKYNRHGGSVSVSCFEASRGLLRIQVTDTGPGIAPENRDLLFVPFERLGAEQTLIEGTGVGLALSRGLATAMGGRLEVDSTVGRGSTFWLEFPVVESPAHKLDREDEPAPPSPGDKLVVLHIEDNPANVSLVERVLAQRPELAVVPAMQGRTGLEIARRERPAVILLDLNLPDLDGAEILKELRADPKTASIPVIVVSADAMPRQMQHLLSAGATAYLTKPIDIRDLLVKIDEAIAPDVAVSSGESVY